MHNQNISRNLECKEPEKTLTSQTSSIIKSIDECLELAYQIDCIISRIDTPPTTDRIPVKAPMTGDENIPLVQKLFSISDKVAGLRNYLHENYMRLYKLI